MKVSGKKGSPQLHWNYHPISNFLIARIFKHLKIQKLSEIEMIATKSNNYHEIPKFQNSPQIIK